MCGICGAVDFEQETQGGVAALPIDAMVAALAHRGPDDLGVSRDGPVVLGHARLSILDLSAAGHQPMTRDALTIAYNGEIYNFPVLRRELESLGRVFHTRTDTEVVLQAYATWGTAAFARLNGMFACAIWDRASSTFVLARDRFGIKPLYLARTGSTLLFASEIKALMASGCMRRSLNWAALHEYLWFGNSLTPHTMFADVSRLPPGHVLTVTARGESLRPFWRVEEVAPIAPSHGEATKSVRKMLDESVQRHLLSDVPVGVFLSGGIDSSAITAFASRSYVGALHTYAVDFEHGARTSELSKARRVAAHFATTHHEIRIETRNLPSLLERLVIAHDEPFADAANIPLFLLSERLKGDVKVVLQGDGGDELFAGYRRYNVLSALKLWRMLACVASPLDSWWPTGPRAARAQRFLRAIGEDCASDRMALLLTVESRARSPLRVLRADRRALAEAFDPFSRYSEMADRFALSDPVQQMLLTDLHVQLPDTFLEKVDKPTMAHGIEVRVPFLDTELASYAISLPSSLKVQRGQKKYILRAALRGVVPDWVLDAPKMGFDVPYSAWLAGPLLPFARERLLDPGVRDLLDHDTVAQMLNEHASGTADHAFMLWKLLQLVLWLARNDVALD